MKETIKKVETNVKIWVATDGTEFSNSNDCNDYEHSAKGLMRSKVEKLITAKSKDAWELMGGIDDHTINAYKPESREDVDTLIQFLLLENPYLNCDERTDLRNKKIRIIEKALQDKDVVLFGINCDGDYYFINSRQNIINNLRDLDKKEEKDA